MKAKLMNFKNLIDKDIRQKFEDSPLFWSVESDIQFWLAHRIHDKLGEEWATAEVAGFENRSTYNISYKEFLDDTIAEKSEGKEIKRVITEVTFADKKENSDRRKFDLGVLNQGSVKVVLNNGTKNYREQDFDALFELKFVKNDHYYQLLNGENGKNNDHDKMTTFWDKMEDKDESDIKKAVERIIADHSESIEDDKSGWRDDYNLLKDVYKLEKKDNIDNRAIILLSNYDIFYDRDETSKKHLTKNKSNRERVNRIVGKKLHNFIEKKAKERGIDLYYFTPEYNNLKNLKQS